MNNLTKISKAILACSNKSRAKSSSRFFKTGKGQYGEGDKFLGLTVPEIRKIAKEFYFELSLEEVAKLLKSEFHEYRYTALEVLVFKFEKSKTELEQKKVYDFYLKFTKYINNWDLVDTSAYNIVGAYLFKRSRVILKKLAKSNNLWERRIAIVATYHFIRNNDFAETLAISKILLSDEQDLIHKAVGWMLREVGKKDLKTETNFLDLNAKKMPRTMLRYAIERFPEKLRLHYLNSSKVNK